MENDYIVSLKKIYSIIEPIGNGKSKKKRKQFFKQVTNWNNNTKYTEIYLPVTKRTVYLSHENTLNFNGKEAISLNSFIESIKFCLRRGLTFTVMQSLDPLNLVSERLKNTRSLVTSEINVCLKEFLAYSFMCILIKEGIDEFIPSDHGDKLCEFLNEIGVVG